MNYKCLDHWKTVKGQFLPPLNILTKSSHVLRRGPTPPGMDGRFFKQAL